jgi:hypothetical protein
MFFSFGRIQFIGSYARFFPFRIAHCPGVRAMETGQPAEVETTGIRDDGTSFSVRVQAFPVCGLNGKPDSFFVGLCLDKLQDILALDGLAG